MKEEDPLSWLYGKIKSASEFLQKSLLNMLRLVCIQPRQSWESWLIAAHKDYKYQIFQKGPLTFCTTNANAIAPV